jgi:hypothetical protein
VVCAPAAVPPAISNARERIGTRCFFIIRTSGRELAFFQLGYSLRTTTLLTTFLKQENFMPPLDFEQSGSAYRPTFTTHAIARFLSLEFPGNTQR